MDSYPEPSSFSKHDSNKNRTIATIWMHGSTLGGQKNERKNS